VVRIEAELFTDGSNNAVVRLPGRRFPSVLVQGDTLAQLRVDLAEVQQALSGGDFNGANDSLAFVLNDLGGWLGHYIEALEKRGIPCSSPSNPSGPLGAN
jgi:hypothetical protein